MYQKLIEENWEDYVALLRGAIEIPSVKGEAQEGAPFGAQSRRVLDYVLEKAKSYGMEVQNVENAMGYAQLGDDQDGYIGILGHLDVVAAEENNWISPAFVLAERDGFFYGRGVLDNKGPILSCLFALKLLKDQGFQPKKSIRIIFGTDEETGAADVPIYLSKEEEPIFGFTPDCKFPVVYGERGVVALKLITQFNKNILNEMTDFQGEMAKEFVPDELSVTIGGINYTSKGKRSPSNAPEMGENAITALAEKLSQELDSGELQTYFAWLSESFHNNHFGRGIGLDFHDEESGRLILTPYDIKKVGENIELSISIRYPVTVTEKDVISGLSKYLHENTEIEILRSMPGTNFDKTKKEVELLSNIYEEVTGLDGKPVTTTGATYARFMPNIVAFGPSFPGEKGIAHKENEYMEISHLKLMIEIYMKAIEQLCQ